MFSRVLGGPNNCIGNIEADLGDVWVGYVVAEQSIYLHIYFRPLNDELLEYIWRTIRKIGRNPDISLEKFKILFSKEHGGTPDDYGAIYHWLDREISIDLADKGTPYCFEQKLALKKLMESTFSASMRIG